MLQLFAIAGALGAVARFWLSSGVYRLLGRAFPWGTLVRVYFTEASGARKPLLHCLHDETGIGGATVTRGVAGFGTRGRVRDRTLLMLATDLPLVLEFFEEPARACVAIERIKAVAQVSHVISWPVQVEPL